MKKEILSSNSVKFTFTITADEFEHGLSHAFEVVGKDVEIKGFRKGKVPREIFEKRFGVESLYEEAINHLLPEKYNEAFTDPTFEPVGQPKIDLDFENVKRGTDFEFTATVSVKPEVTLGAYKGLKGNKMNLEVTDAEVEAEVQNLLTKNASLEPKTEGTLAMGDTSIIDFEGFVDGIAFPGGKGDNFTLEIGSGQFIPGFEQGMIGMALNETRDVVVKFPESYHAEDLAGKDATFKVTLHEMKTKQGETLTDDFVKTLNREGIETVEALKNDIREKAAAAKKTQERGRLIDQLVDLASQNATVDIPQEMIDHEIEHMKEDITARAKQYNMELEMFVTLSGSTMEKFEADIQAEAAKKVRYNLVLEAIVAAENFAIDESVIEEKYAGLAAQYNMPVEDIKKYINPDMLGADLKIEKAFDFLIENAELV